MAPAEAAKRERKDGGTGVGDLAGILTMRERLASQMIRNFGASVSAWAKLVE